MRGRLACLGFALTAIVAGLALRLGPWRLPLPLHHYGGSVLWGMMLLALVAAIRPRRSGLAACLALAGASAACIEFIRLVHTTELDTVRRTLAGQLLLGSLFSAWNLLAYAVGIGLMALVLRPVVRRRLLVPGRPGLSLDTGPAPSEASFPSALADGQ